MKIVEYTLGADGTIPTFILDGGYFPHPNINPSPQDQTLIGVANDDAPGRVFANASELSDYLADVGSGWFVLNPDTGEKTPFNPTDAAAKMWAKLG